MNKTLCTSLYIAYAVSGRYEAAYVSEFFKMCGIQVIEQEFPEGTVQYEDLIRNCSLYDHILYMGIESVDYEEYFALDCKRNAELMTRISYSSSFLDNYKQNNYVALHADLLSTAQKVLGYQSNALSDLVMYYVYKNYCKLSFIKRYFSFSLEKEEKRQLYKRFLDVLYGIDENLNIRNDSYILSYGTYAKLLCARKVNDLCCEMQSNFYFQPEKMIDTCLKITDYTEHFSSAYALAASFCCCDASFRASVVPFYRKALEKNESHPAYINIYYQLGQYYEKTRKDLERATEVYEKAYSVLPGNYRVLFKKGASQLDEKKYSSAIKTYKQVIESLKCKREYQQLFPVEYEYLCKCYLLIGLIYDYHWSDELQGSVYYKEAIEVVEKELERSTFFGDFLGDEKNVFRECLKQRIALREHILVEKYR